MNVPEEIEYTLAEHKEDLMQKYKVKELGIFGSYIRGKQRKRSDLDVLVKFEEPIGLLKFIALERHLSRLLGRKVDLVMKSALKPTIGSYILEEVKYI